MKITSAEFIKGVVGADRILENGIPQVAFIGRSNVGKSSVINSLTGQKNLARSSSFPGCTQEINIFLINGSFYSVDLPGYGFTKASLEVRERLEKLICWYLFDSKYKQKKVILIIDAKIGPTKDDLDMLYSLKERKKNIVIVANKIDKIKKSECKHQLQKIEALVGANKFIPYSAEKNIGVRTLIKELLIR
jgi:GTP-binding protein